MLSKKEKQEMLEDGLSAKRRKEFAQVSKITQPSSKSLDEFINFLMSIQNIFSPFSISRKKTITRFNRL